MSLTAYDMLQGSKILAFHGGHEIFLFQNLCHHLKTSNQCRYHSLLLGTYNVQPGVKKGLRME